MNNQDLRFLLLEDDSDHIELFLANLELTSYHNAAVDQCDSLEGGLEMLADTAYDLIFADLSLRDSTVISTLGRLKELSVQAPVVVVTSLDDKETLLDIIQKGADDCIPKSELNGFALERCIHYNIDRQDLNKQLLNSESAYKDLYHNSPIYHATFTPINGEITSCNTTLAKSIGWHAKDLLGINVLGLYHSNCLEKAKILHDQLHETGVIQNEHLQLLRSDGSAQDVLLNVSSVKDASGKAERCHATWVDITEKLKTEQELHNLQALNQQILDIVSSPIWLKDLEGRYLACNNSFCELLGEDKETIIGSLCSDFFDEEHCQKIIALDKKALQATSSSEKVWIAPKKTNRNTLLEITKTPLYGESDEIIGVVSHGHDITAHYS